MKDPTRAVIFDLDGVIADTEHLHIQAWKRLFPRMGVDPGRVDFDSGIGVSDVVFVRDILDKLQADDDPENWLEQKGLIYRSILKDDLKTFPGACALIKELSAAYRTAIASNGRSDDVALTVKLLNLSGFFEFALSRDDVTNHKPYPDIYLLAARRLGLPPSGCVVVEDSTVGVEAAKRAGMKCVAVASSHAAGKLSGADAVVKDLVSPGETVRIIQRLLNGMSAKGAKNEEGHRNTHV